MQKKKKIIVIVGSAAAKARHLDKAVLIPKGRDWTNMKIMESGIMAWPFSQEKLD